jgi:hypothetical protein
LSEPILNRNGEESDKVKQTERVDKKYTAPDTPTSRWKSNAAVQKKFDLTVERPQKTQVKPRR